MIIRFVKHVRTIITLLLHRKSAFPCAMLTFVKFVNQHPHLYAINVSVGICLAKARINVTIATKPTVHHVLKAQLSVYLVLQVTT